MRLADKWYNAHCDDENGFVCKRAVGSTDPLTPPPTALYQGYCPDGFFGLGGTGAGRERDGDKRREGDRDREKQRWKQR